MKVVRWGNSLAIRLPRSVVNALDIKEGDDITLEVADARHPSVSRNPSRTELLDRLRKYRGSLPADFKFDRLEANAR
jgi:antitoxin MazE